MHSVVIASLLVLTGICAYAAVNHAFIAFQRPYSRVHLLFAIICILLVAYELLHILTSISSSLSDYIPRLKWELSVILLTFMVFPWFVGEYSGLRPLWLLVGFSAITGVLILINILQPYSIQFSHISRLLHLRLPWGETVTQPEGRNSIKFFAATLDVLVIFSFAVYALGVHYFRSRLNTTLVMLLAIGLFMAGGIEGILVRMSAIEFIHLGPFGILAMIIAMSMALSQEMQHKLRASENRYRSLVEQSPFSMQVLSPDGVTLQVNKAWENLWGVSAVRTGNYNLLNDQQLRDKGVMPYLQRGFNGNATEIPPIQYNPAENPVLNGSNRNQWVRAFVYPVKDETDIVREVVILHEDVTEKKRFDDSIRLVATGISVETGEVFFQQLVKSLAELFEMKYAFVGVLDTPDADVVKTVAVYANGRLARNLTYELKGTPCATVVGQHTCAYPSDVQKFFPEDRLLVEMGAHGYLGAPLFDPKGNPLGIIVMLDSKPLRDVEHMIAIMEIVAARTAAEIERDKADELLRRQHTYLQDMVDQRTSELQAAVRELEAFSYSVSHDLRAPLRSIDGFSQALVEDYFDILNEEGKDYLKRIRGNAQRMAMLIDDLLQLSRVTRKDFNKKPVNLSKLVQDSIDKYKEQDPARKIKTDISTDIFVEADPDLLVIAIDNLVSNAWKYTGKAECAKIEFGSMYLDEKLTYYIKDNGVGFDMKFADKIFGAFQRLHTEKEFEGTGIGLATVVRIVNRHGGEIWADAHPNGGAVFYFRLPGVSEFVTENVSNIRG